MNILRYYICDHCDYHFTEVQERDQKLFKKCPQCKKYKLYQDLTGQHCTILKEPKTLIQQACLNTKKMGRYELEARRRKDKLENEIMRKKPLIEKGLLSPDSIGKEPDHWWGDIEPSKKKEVLKDKKKAKKYIKEGI